jgi:hypothetical protein
MFERIRLAPIAFASLMAAIDTVSLSGLKQLSTGDARFGLAVPLSMLVYSLQPLIFFHALRFESMTVMNVLWDVMSDLYVTAIGLFYFNERLSATKLLALAFAFVAITLFSFDSLYGE